MDVGKSSAAIYCRISRDTEGLGLGVARQQESCRDLASSAGLEVVATFTDNDVSATRGKRRQGFEALLEAAKGGSFATIIAWHVDRLTRSPRELERLIDVLEQANVTVLTVTAGALDLSTASGRMQARVVGAVARHESEQKSERIRAKQAQLAAAGKRGGGGERPYGYQADHQTINVDEAAVIVRCAQDVLAGRPVRSIVRGLNDARIPSARGGRWTPTSVRRMLSSARIAGLREHQGEIVATAVWPAIVDRETWEVCRRILLDPARRKNMVMSKYLLSGLVFCSLCKAKMVSRPNQNKTRGYVCASDVGGCGRMRVMADGLEEMVTADVLTALEQVDFTAVKLAAPDAKQATLTIVDIEQRLSGLADDFAQGTISRAEWLRARTGLQERLHTAQLTLTQVDTGPIPTGDLRQRWPALDLFQRRAVIDAVLEQVVIAPGVRGLNRFDPARVTYIWKH